MKNEQITARNNMSRFCSTDVKIKNLFMVDSRDTEGEEKKRNCRIPCEIAEIETTSWRTSGAAFNASETEKKSNKRIKANNIPYVQFICIKSFKY